MTAAGGRLITLPPWLWIWLAWYLWWLARHLPFRLAEIRDELGVAARVSALEGSSTVYMLLIAEAASSIPTLIMMLGVSLVALPALRGRWLERNWRLSAELPSSDAAGAVADYVAQRAPDLALRWNLARGSQVAFVYPLGLRRDALAIFGGLLVLWRRDRKMAESVVDHELGHHVRREALIFGSGSLIEWAARRWWLLALLVVVPQLAFHLAEEARKIAAAIASAQEELEQHREFIDAMRAAGSTAEEIASYEQFAPASDWFAAASRSASHWAGNILPGVLLSVLAELGGFLAAILLFVAAVWCAELQADRHAIGHAGSAEAFRTAMAPRGSSRLGFWRWLLGRISHPPPGLRRWAARQPEDPARLLVLLLIPAAAVLLIFVLRLPEGAQHYQAMTAGTGTFLVTLPEQLPEWFGLFLGGYWLLFAGILVITIGWTVPQLATMGRTWPAGAAIAVAASVVAVPAVTPLWLPRAEAEPIESPGAFPPLMNISRMSYRADEAVVVGYAGMSPSEGDGFLVVPEQIPGGSREIWVPIATDYGRIELPRMAPGTYRVRLANRTIDGQERTEFEWPVVVEPVDQGR